MNSEPFKVEFTPGTLGVHDVHFLLKLHRNDYEIKHVSNVNFQGMDILLPVKLNDKTTVKLSYHSDEMNFSIKARVAACLLDFCQYEQSRNQSLYQVKIVFSPENGELNPLFFMAVRKYLDKFDGQHLLE